MKLKDLPVALQRKVGELDVDGMQRIQFYPADLAYLLNLNGDIADMFVENENGIQVLRMTVIPLEPTEYKTVRAPKGSVPLPKPKKQPKSVKPEVKKKGLLERLADNNREWKSRQKDSDTNWIQRFSEGPRF